MRISRLVAGVIALLALVPMATAAGKRTPVRAPKSGVYDGTTSQHRKISLQIGGRKVSQVVFSFPCRKMKATGSLQDIRLKKGRSGFRFAILAYSSIQYTNEDSENGPVRIRGTFSRSGTRVSGRVRVRTHRCGVTRFRWSAKRRTKKVAYPLPSG